MPPTSAHTCHIAECDDRGVVWVRGPDAAKLLQGLITNDISRLDAEPAIHAGLLSPQGKILFEFFVARTDAGYVLETARDQVAGLVKRLTLYKLRADVSIQDASSAYKVLVLWGEHAASSGETAGTVSFPDPRDPRLGRRILAEARFAADISSATNGMPASADAYHTHRIALGVPEGGRDYDFGETFPHDADFDLFDGVSFTKGCYVGQEIVARTEHKTTVRKRIVKVIGDAALPAARPQVQAGDVAIGQLGSVSGETGLALLRLDRVEEFAAKGVPLTAGGVALSVAPAALALANTRGE